MTGYRHNEVYIFFYITLQLIGWMYLSYELYKWILLYDSFFKALSVLIFFCKCFLELNAQEFFITNLLP